MKLQAYFQAYRSYFWQWEDKTTVLAIPNGSTIAYKPFVLEVMEQIAPTGTPPFGALLLMLIATNPTAEDDLEQIKKMIARLNPTEQKENGSQVQAFEFLNKIQALPEIYKTGVKRTLLLQTVFKDSHNHISTKKVTQILRDYKQHKEVFPHLILSEEKAFHLDVLYKDFRGFRFMNEKFPTSKSILEALANLPKVEEEEIEKITTEATESIDAEVLLEQLLDAPETFLVAALVKFLWSGLNLSLQKLSPTEQPLGGVSDITNKGNFDRLLISEFAYDEVSFLSRLANNEALYLHRETPPAANHLERVILIDVSLKNWGTPKTIAHAVLLALAYHPKAKTNCKAYAIGGPFMSKAIQFDSLDAIIDSLQFLDPTLDCSKGLNNFLKNGLPSKQTEIIYIGVQEAIQSNAFRQAIQSYESYFQYWIHPNSEGQIKVYKSKNKAKKHIQTIQLPLEKLWANKKVPVLKRSKMEHSHNCPILVPQPIQAKRILFTSDDEVFVVTKEKNLLRFAGSTDHYRKKGYELMYHNLPFTSGIYEIGLTSNGSYILLVFDLQSKTLSLIDCQTKEMKQAPFDAWVSGSRKEFLFHQDVFYYFAKNKCWSFDFYAKKIITATDRPADFFELYDHRQTELEDFSKRFGYSASLLKNIQTVDLNTNGNLVFNGKHELFLNPYGVIKLDLSNTLRDQYKAINTVNKREFIFEDGSKIKLVSFGLILLISSDSSLPVVYVPMNIDAALGIGTEDFFAGNDCYFPRSNAEGLTIMNTKKFWKKFISPFIETIKSHGITNKTK